MRTQYKTIVISDLHLGIKSSHAREVIRFLKANSCEKLILNGDIIDGWRLHKEGMKRKHLRFLELIIHLSTRRSTEVVYLRGNHDDFLDEMLPYHNKNFSIVNDHIHISNGKRYFVTHGDIFDSITTHLTWLAHLGDTGYNFLLWLNRHYNHFRHRQGLPYYSLSQRIKSSFKHAVSYISSYEQKLCEVARARKCDGIITGHIHQPADKHINGVHYLNSGDWVETLSALVETHGGQWQVVYYHDWLMQHELEQRGITVPVSEEKERHLAGASKPA